MKKWMEKITKVKITKPKILTLHFPDISLHTFSHSVLSMLILPILSCSLQSSFPSVNESSRLWFLPSWDFSSTYHMTHFHLSHSIINCLELITILELSKTSFNKQPNFSLSGAKRVSKLQQRVNVEANI